MKTKCAKCKACWERMEKSGERKRILEWSRIGKECLKNADWNIKHDRPLATIASVDTAIGEIAKIRLTLLRRVKRENPSVLVEKPNVGKTNAKVKRNCDRFKTFEAARSAYRKECCAWRPDNYTEGRQVFTKKDENTPDFDEWLFESVMETPPMKKNKRGGTAKKRK